MNMKSIIPATDITISDASDKSERLKESEFKLRNENLSKFMKNNRTLTREQS